MRSKYATYPEYHTSLDDLTLVTAQGLGESLALYKQCIELLEANQVYKNQVLCEPQLGKRGLYPTLSTKASNDQVRDMMNFLAYADGTRDLIDILDKTGADARVLLPVIKRLLEEELIK